MILCVVWTVISCYEKALFLLKFAGLSRVDQEGGLDNQARVDSGSAVSTVGRLKQQVPHLTLSPSPCVSSLLAAQPGRAGSATEKTTIL